MANGTLKVSNIETSSGSGTITIGQSGETVDMSNATKVGFGGINTPAFFAHSASDQGSVSDNTYVKVTLGTEVFDVGACFGSSRFTVPSGEAGKYFLYGSVRGQVGGNSDMNNCYSAFYLNGSIYIENRMNFQSNPVRLSTNLVHAVLDLSVGDYVELYAAIDHAGSYGIEIGSALKGTSFGGYKIIE